jgi:DNA-binding FrmR family transcriptional regulator
LGGTVVPNHSGASLIIYSAIPLTRDDMRKGTILTTLIAALLLIPVTPWVMALPTDLSVKTDQTHYRPGEVVKVSGVATVTGAVTLIFKVGAEIIITVNPIADGDGKYQYSYNLPADPEVGTWTIEAKDLASKTAVASFTVLKANLKEITEKLLQITQTSESLVKAKLGDSPPQAAKENYEAGVKALNEAQSSLTSEKYAASIQASLRAQKHFGNALKILALGHPQQTIDDETRLTNQIERAQHMLNGLKTLNENIENELKKASLKTELDAAQVEIDAAVTHLAKKEYSLAQDSLTSASEHMKTARTLLQEFAIDRKKEQIISFIDKTEERIGKLKETVETLRERIGNDQAKALLQKLEKIEIELKTLRGLVDDDATLTELNIQMRAIQDAIGELHNTAIRDALREMDSMHAWIQLMKETRGIMLKKGFNTNDLDAKIRLGENTLGETIRDLQVGRKIDSRFSDIIKSFMDAYRNRGH